MLPNNQLVSMICNFFHAFYKSDSVSFFLVLCFSTFIRLAAKKTTKCRKQFHVVCLFLALCSLTHTHTRSRLHTHTRHSSSVRIIKTLYFPTEVSWRTHRRPEIYLIHIFHDDTDNLRYLLRYFYRWLTDSLTRTTAENQPIKFPLLHTLPNRHYRLSFDSHSR